MRVGIPLDKAGREESGVGPHSKHRKCPLLFHYLQRLGGLLCFLPRQGPGRTVKLKAVFGVLQREGAPGVEGSLRSRREHGLQSGIVPGRAG